MAARSPEKEEKPITTTTTPPPLLGVSKNRIYVGNLSQKTKQRDVEQLFQRFGKLREVSLKGHFGFVEYEDDRDAEEAVRKLDDIELDGNRIKTEFARDKDKSNRPGTGKCFRCGVEGHWARECGRRRSRSPPRRRTPPRRSRSPPRRRYDFDDRYDRGEKVANKSHHAGPPSSHDRRWDDYYDDRDRYDRYPEPYYRDRDYRDDYRGPPRDYRGRPPPPRGYSPRRGPPPGRGGYRYDDAKSGPGDANGYGGPPSSSLSSDSVTTGALLDSRGTAPPQPSHSYDSRMQNYNYSGTTAEGGSVPNSTNYGSNYGAPPSSTSYAGSTSSFSGTQST